MKPVRTIRCSKRDVTRKTDTTNLKSAWRTIAVAGEYPSGSDRPSDARASQLGPPPANQEVAPPVQSGQRGPSILPAGGVAGHSAPTAGEPVDGSPWQDRVGTLRISSWLVSAVVHLIVLILLALLTRQLGHSDRGVSLRAAWSSSSRDAPLKVIALDAEAKESDEPLQESVVPVNLPQPDSGFVRPDSPNPNDSQNQRDQLASALLSGGASQRKSTRMYLGGGEMTARTPEGRIKYGKLYGATPESEQAVERALRWLADHQRRDGSWSFNLDRAPCEGRCRDGRPNGDDTPTPATAASTTRSRSPSPQHAFGRPSHSPAKGFVATR